MHAVEEGRERGEHRGGTRRDPVVQGGHDQHAGGAGDGLVEHLGVGGAIFRIDFQVILYIFMHFKEKKY